MFGGGKTPTSHWILFENNSKIEFFKIFLNENSKIRIWKTFCGREGFLQ